MNTDFSWRSFIVCLITALSVSVSGCMSWEDGWTSMAAGSSKGDVKGLFDEAKRIENRADNGERVKELIAAYKKIAALQPANYEALSRIGEYSFLYGYIYANSEDEKSRYYRDTLKYCEQAMYTNENFKKEVAKGKPVWEAASALTANEMASMFYWYCGVGNYWKDCHNVVSQLVNYSWPARAKLVLERMTEINPDWDGGNVHMSWGAYYSALPGLLGGDTKKSESCFAKAIAVDPQHINHLFVRALFLHTKKGDKKAFQKDLNEVLAKDIRTLNFPYPWAAGYQVKAKRLLAQTESFF
ncbi:MAG TPA: TRAP transporter TatT component family protein [Spirochaetota bacterium]|nr:TRAP transporter TatT component family protein [Spirochaetota bacterium]